MFSSHPSGEKVFILIVNKKHVKPLHKRLGKKKLLACLPACLDLASLEGRRTLAMTQFFKLIVVDCGNDFVDDFFLLVVVVVRAAVFKILGFHGFGAVSSTSVVMFICE